VKETGLARARVTDDDELEDVIRFWARGGHRVCV
jgi:hypothetical protein